MACNSTPEQCAHPSYYQEESREDHAGGLWLPHHIWMVGQSPWTHQSSFAMEVPYGEGRCSNPMTFTAGLPYYTDAASGQNRLSSSSIKSHISEYGRHIHRPALSYRWSADFRHPSPEGTMSYSSVESFHGTFSQDGSDRSSPSPTLISPEMRWASIHESSFSPLAESSYGCIGIGVQNIGVALSDIQSSMDSHLDSNMGESCSFESPLDTYTEDYGSTNLGSERRGSSTSEASISNLNSSSESARSAAADDGDSDYEPVRKRNHRSATTPSSVRTNKVTKRPKTSPSARKNIKASSSPPKKLTGDSIPEETPGRPAGERVQPYSCPLRPYGCLSLFGSKNEWKRHLTSQHLSDGYFRCDLCTNKDRDPNDFNRKDLFIQHLRRMHPDNGKDFEGIADRCFVHLHSEELKFSCVFCSKKFTGAKSCHEWIEHINKELVDASRDATSQDQIQTAPWENDTVLRAWLLNEGLIVAGSGQIPWEMVPASAALERRSRAFARKTASSCIDKAPDAEGDVDD